MKFIYLITVCICLANCTNPEEVQKVTETFESYKAALINNDIDKAVDLVDQKTLDYYAALLIKIQKSDSVALEQIEPMEKHGVLSVRHLASQEQILSFTPRSLLSFFLKEGLEGKSRVTKNDIGKVKISGTTATAQLISGVKITTLEWTFTKEGAQWNFNLIDLYPVAYEQFNKMIAKSEVEENTLLLEQLEKMSGVLPDSAIWEPLGN